MSHQTVTVRRLELRVRRGTLPWDESVPYDTVDLVLDGRDLWEWLRPYAARMPSPEPASLGHPVGTDLTAILLGGGRAEEEYGGRTALLGCSCTVIDCSPLVARVAVGAERVTWSEFSRFRGPHVDFPGLELEFDREAYLGALEDYEQRHL